MTLPAAWTPMRVVPAYQKLVNSTARFDVIEAGRRSGKTELVKRMAVKETWLGGHAFGRWYCKLCAPTRQQAKDIYWRDILDLTAGLHAREPNLSDLVVYLKGGGEIWICGLDRPQRIEGSPINRLAVDELADVKPDAWERNLQPALDTKMPGFPRARAWLFGVPRPGAQFSKLAKWAQDPTMPDYAYHTWKSSEVLDPDVIALAKRTMDPLIFAQEYEAQRVSMEGRAYYQFGPANIREVTYQPGLPLMFCFDFNRSPGVCVVAQEQGLAGESVASCDYCQTSDPGRSGEPCRQCQRMLPLATSSCAVGEVHIPRGSNTTMVCTRLAADWGHHKGPVICYGDPAGGAKTASSVEGSDWDLIRAYFRQSFPQAVFDVDRKHPSQRSRVNSVNMRCQNAAGERRLFINPTKAPNVLRDMQEQALVKGGSGELDKDSDPTLGHAADGWGYAIQKLYPVTDGSEGYIEAA